MLWLKSVLETSREYRKSLPKKPSNRSRKRSSFRLDIERLESRQLMADDVSHNPFNPNDVNNDSLVTPLDALIVINALNREREAGINSIVRNPFDSTTCIDIAFCRDYFLDTNDDKVVSLLDVLAIVDELNSLTHTQTDSLLEGEESSAEIRDRSESDGTPEIEIQIDVANPLTARLASKFGGAQFLHRAAALH